jgi:hypothetical protein
LRESTTFENVDNSKDMDDIDLINNELRYKLSKSNYCSIKFGLLLIYYTLNVYYIDIINEEYLQIVTPTDRFLENILIFFKKLFIFF